MHICPCAWNVSAVMTQFDIFTERLRRGAAGGDQGEADAAWVAALEAVASAGFVD
jgi:hypothetical protein